MVFMAVLLLADYIGDFLLQPRNMAVRKSKDNEALADHGAIVTVVLATAIMISRAAGIIPPEQVPIAALLSIAYGALHMVQDKLLWSLYSRIRKNKCGFKYYEDKLFYDFIGLDRLLHVLTIICLFWWIA